jgi:hypothetical protein
MMIPAAVAAAAVAVIPNIIFVDDFILEGLTNSKTANHIPWMNLSKIQNCHHQYRDFPDLPLADKISWI